MFDPRAGRSFCVEFAFPLQVLRPPARVQRHDLRLFSDSKLAIDVNVTVNGFLAIF